ncbi:MAG: DUF790 family protein [Candidatus Bathyarchaeia archaeon]
MTLPLELLRFRLRKGTVIPLYADEEKISLGKTLISVFQNNLGKRYRDLKESLDSCEDLGYNYKLVRGLGLVLERRCKLGSKLTLNPIEIRKAIFEEVGSRVIATEKARQEILSKVSSKFGVDPSEMENALYADLLDEQRVLGFTPPEPMELLKEYNFALTTGILTQSDEMELTFKGSMEKPSIKLGESEISSEGGFKRFKLMMHPTKHSKSRISELEKMTARLMLQDGWRIKAVLRRSGRIYILEVSQEKHGRLVTPRNLYSATCEAESPPAEEKPLPNVVLVEELAASQGITETSARRVLRARGDFVDLGSVFVSKTKLDLIAKELEKRREVTLGSVVETFKKIGCQHPIQVLEALGYTIEWAETRAESRVYRFKR